MAITVKDIQAYIRQIREKSYKEYTEALNQAVRNQGGGYSYFSSLSPYDSVLKSAYIHPFKHWGEEKFENENLFYAYETGGVSGGSCWESSNPQSYEAENKDTGFVILVWVLEKFAPNITFLKYQKLSKSISSFEHTEYEYYGNRTDYKVQYLSLDTLVDFINSNT